MELTADCCPEIIRWLTERHGASMVILTLNEVIVFVRERREDGISLVSEPLLEGWPFHK